MKLFAMAGEGEGHLVGWFVVKRNVPIANHTNVESLASHCLR